MHAKLEARELKAEDLHTPLQRREASVRDALAAVRAEAALDALELVEQLGGGGKGVVAEAVPERRETAAVRLVLVLSARHVADVAESCVGVDERRRHAPGARERLHVRL